MVAWYLAGPGVIGAGNSGPGCAAKLCPTLCDPTDCSPPGSSAHGSLQARILEWIVMSSSGGIFPDPGIESVSPAAPALQVDSLLLRHQGSPSKYMWMCKLLNDFLLCLQRF